MLTHFRRRYAAHEKRPDAVARFAPVVEWR